MVKNLAERLTRVPASEDVVDYTLRCAVEAGANESLMRMLDEHIREIFGGDRVYIPTRRGAGHSERNAKIRRDYQSGERVELLIRRYSLSRRRIYEILEQ